jgi:effector protein SdbA
LGGAVATLAAAQLHERGYHVKLYNLRSFRSLSRVIMGYFLPNAKDNWSHPLTYLKYFAVALSGLFIPLIWLSGWRLNAERAWDKIPTSNKDYALVREIDDNQKITVEVDGLIHDTHYLKLSSVADKRAPSYVSTLFCPYSHFIPSQLLTCVNARLSH